MIADARAKVNACVSSRPQFRKIDGFLAAVRDFRAAVYTNAEALAAATPTTDPSYQTRRANARRIARTAGPLHAIHFSVPTVAACLALGQTRYGLIGPTVPVKGGP